jgi:hypothetical protein
LNLIHTRTFSHFFCCYSPHCSDADKVYAGDASGLFEDAYEYSDDGTPPPGVAAAEEGIMATFTSLFGSAPSPDDADAAAAAAAAAAAQGRSRRKVTVLSQGAAAA